MGFVFVLLLTALLVILYYHYFKKDTSDTNTSNQVNTDNTNITGNGGFDSKDSGAVAGPDQPPNSDTSGTSSQTTDGNTDNSDNGDSNPTTTTDPYVYYNQGLVKINSKEYQAAIAFFDQAIGINKQISDFYSKKAEAQVSLGQKADAIATVEAGLAALPGNELLQNKLDIIKATVK